MLLGVMGEPVTAKDFIYAWQRLATPANQANYMFYWTGTFKNGTSQNHPRHWGKRPF